MSYLQERAGRWRNRLRRPSTILTGHITRPACATGISAKVRRGRYRRAGLRRGWRVPVVDRFPQPQAQATGSRKKTRPEHRTPGQSEQRWKPLFVGPYSCGERRRRTETCALDLGLAENSRTTKRRSDVECADQSAQA
ncbi:hypothetical protein D3C84_792470 [compost metagenome]